MDSEECILLAEDNQGDVYLAKLALRDSGLDHEIHVLGDGEAAIAFVDRMETGEDELKVALVLLDLHLPRRDGVEVLRRLRASDKGRRVPVMVLTSSDSPADRQSAEVFEHVCFFRKPSSLDEFLALGAVAKNLIDEANDLRATSAGVGRGSS